MGSEDKSGRSNRLEPYSGTTDWSMHSDSHSGDVNGSLHGQHLDIIPELIGGNGTSMHADTHPQVTDRSGSVDHFDINPFKTVPDVAGENDERGKHMVMHPVSESDRVFSVKNLRSFSSCSSSASSSSEDLFQVDTGLGNFEPHARASKDEEITVSNNNSSKSKASDKSPGPTSASQFYQVTSESMIHNMPPTKSPKRQVMDRSGEYDPLRIPSVVFERSISLTRQEWSVASNESLFSIHIGNNSFSRDPFKSGEHTKTDELIMFNPSPSIPEVGADREVAEFEKSDATRGAVKNTKNAPKETTVDKNQDKASHANILRNPSDMSHHSNESSHSFAFPIKKKMKMKNRCFACGCIPFFCCGKKCRRKKCTWPSCYCSNCSCTLCFCSRPSWPSCCCSNCSWAFCYSWNCSLKRWCCHSSITLTDRVKSVIVKPDVAEKHQKKPLAAEAMPKSSSNCRWFSCFSCHPCSCSFPCFRCFPCCCR